VVRKMKPEETVDYHIKTTWHAISRMYNQKASSYKGTMSIGFVLLNIRLEEGTPATKIAPQMGLESRSLTRILKRLEEEGLIYKEPDPVDGRSVRIFLTEEGEKKRRIAADTVKTFNSHVYSKISREKLKVFFEVMNEINRVVDLETNEKSNNSKNNIPTQANN
jgi:MarR family transcriptional regulator, organic hydroperoxide resistance regulator